MREKRIEYSTDGLKVIWQPDMCAHVGLCTKLLPEVYRPNERPWIQVDRATPEELKAQIDKCPSGALSYEECER